MIFLIALVFGAIQLQSIEALPVSYHYCLNNESNPKIQHFGVLSIRNLK